MRTVLKYALMVCEKKHAPVQTVHEPILHRLYMSLNSTTDAATTKKNFDPLIEGSMAHVLVLHVKE